MWALTTILSWDRKAREDSSEPEDRKSLGQSEKVQRGRLKAHDGGRGQPGLEPLKNKLWQGQSVKEVVLIQALLSASPHSHCPSPAQVLLLHRVTWCLLTTELPVVSSVVSSPLLVHLAHKVLPSGPFFSWCTALPWKITCVDTSLKGTTAHFNSPCLLENQLPFYNALATLAFHELPT